MSAYKGNKHDRESKVCPVCEKPFTNRKKWSSRGLWDSIKYCSERCRRSAGKSADGDNL